MSLSAILPKALEKLYKLSLREEMESFDRERFVDFRLLSQLETHDWQVIFGRRGAGKTMLLNAFGDYIAKQEKDSYCLYIDMRHCIPSAKNLGEAISHEHVAVEYFYEFIRMFASKLFDEYTDQSDLSPLQRVIRAVSGNRAELDALVLDIHEIAEYAPLRKVPVSATGSKQASKNLAGEGGIAATIGIESSLSDISSTGSLKSNIGVSSERRSTQNDSVEYVFESARRYQPLRRKLETMMRAVNVQHLYVLIDEWADFERMRDNNVQAYFAELLRRTFGGSSLITIKIAGIKDIANFNQWRPQGGIGLELGADIFPAWDLDQVYCSEDNAHAYYAEMMFKRLCKVDGRIKQYSETDELGQFTGKPPEGFFSYLFKEEDSLMDLVRGSGRIPRDFIRLFCHCANEKQFDITPKWRKGELLNLIKDYSINTKDSVISATDGRRTLFNQIIEVARQTGSRIFLVRKDCNEPTWNTLSELYDYRLIHPIDVSKIPRALRNDYNCYHSDYGYYLEAYSEFEVLEQEAVCPTTLASGDDGILKKYTVQLIDSMQYNVSCVHCDRIFSSSEPSYLLKGLCPKCFEPAKAMVVEPESN